MTGPKTTKLVALLEEFGLVLGELDHAHWADWMVESARRLRQSDFSGIRCLLGAYGGMGSVNDILPQLEGEQPDAQVSRARRLRSEIWVLAEEIRREAQVG